MKIITINLNKKNIDENQKVIINVSCNKDGDFIIHELSGNGITIPACILTIIQKLYNDKHFDNDILDILSKQIEEMKHD